MSKCSNDPHLPYSQDFLQSSPMETTTAKVTATSCHCDFQWMPGEVKLEQNCWVSWYQNFGSQTSEDKPTFQFLFSEITQFRLSPLNKTMSFSIPKVFIQNYIWFFITVISNKGKGHSNWFKTVKLSDVYPDTKFEWDQSISNFPFQKQNQPSTVPSL